MEELDYIKNIWMPPNYTELLKLLEKKYLLFDMILNIVLVKLGARPATLIELNNFDNIDDKVKSMYKQILDIIIEKMNMIKTKNTSYRYFVTNNKIRRPKNDNEIAKLLGFECVGHKFFIEDIDRISYSIYETKTRFEL